MVYCIECIHHDLCQFANINKYMCCGSYISKKDIIEVVRCRDCSVPHNKWTGCPKLNGLVTTPDFYCPFGERRTDEHSR